MYKLRSLLPFVTTAEVEGLSTENCSGLCAEGYFCQAGSVSAFQQPCPSGRFGAVRGLKDDLCAEVWLLNYPRKEANTHLGNHMYHCVVLESNQ